VGGVGLPYFAMAPTQKAVVASPSQVVINVVVSDEHPRHS
jgi:hypothetical protein